MIPSGTLHRLSHPNLQPDGIKVVGVMLGDKRREEGDPFLESQVHFTSNSEA